MIIRIIIILLFSILDSRSEFTCDRVTNIHSTNAEGILYSKWKSVENDKINYTSHINLQASSQNSTHLYYRQSLVEEKGKNTYTAITKVDGEFKVLWKKVYKTRLDTPEKIVLDNLEHYLYTILNIGETLNNYDIIVKHNQSDGNFVESIKLEKPGQYRLSNLQYDASNFNISFLKTRYAPMLREVCYIDANLNIPSVKCYYKSDQGNIALSYHFKNVFVLSFMLLDEYYIEFIDLSHETEFRLKIDNSNSLIRMENATEKEDYFIVERDIQHPLLIYRAKIGSNFHINSTNQFTLEDDFINDINIAYNIKRSTCYIFVIYQKIPKIIMIRIKEHTKINTYAIRSLSGKLSYGTSNNRWIYFAERFSKLYTYDNIYRIYDQAIKQSDLVYEVDLHMKTIQKKPQKVEYKFVIFEIINATINESTSDLVSIHEQENDIYLENIALDLEYQHFEIDGFEDYGETRYYDQSCLEEYGNIEFTSRYEPEYIDIDFSRSLIRISATSFTFTTSKDFFVIGKYNEKSYTKPITVQIRRCNVTNCIDCNENAALKKCYTCKSGLKPSLSKDKCILAYTLWYTNILYIILVIISTVTTFCLIILFTSGSRLFMHIVIYFENKFLFIFIANFYSHIIPEELFYKIRYEMIPTEFSIYLPFYPISSVLLYFVGGFVQFVGDTYSLLNPVLIIWTGMVWLVLLILIFCYLYCKNGKITIEGEQRIKYILNLMTFYIFSTNVIYPYNLVFLNHFASAHSRTGYLLVILLIYIPWMLILLSLCAMFVFEISKQITHGESVYGFFGISVMDQTKPIVRCRFFVFAWLVKNLLTEIIDIIIFIIYYHCFTQDQSKSCILTRETFGIMKIFINSVMWLLIFVFLRPFRRGSENFASIVNLFVLALLAMMLMIRYKLKPDEGFFDNFTVTAFVLAASLPGTFIVVFYKFIYFMKNFSVKSYPHVKRIILEIYKIGNSSIKRLSCKRRIRAKNHTNDGNQILVQENAQSQLNSSPVLNISYIDDS